MRIEDINCLIINLPERLDRKTHIEQEVSHVPFKSWRIVEGIRDESNTCTASQKKCIQLAKDNKWPHVMIWEDDNFLCEGAIPIIRSFLLELPDQWNMFYLGANLQEPSQKVSEHVIKLNGAWAAHCYAVHSNFYDHLLSLPNDREMDIHYRYLMRNNLVYMCNPPIAYQLPGISDLQGRFRNYIDEMNHNYSLFLPQ